MKVAAYTIATDMSLTLMASPNPRYPVNGRRFFKSHVRGVTNQCSPRYYLGPVGNSS